MKRRSGWEAEKRIRESRQRAEGVWNTKPAKVRENRETQVSLGRVARESRNLTEACGRRLGTRRGRRVWQVPLEIGD